MNDRSCPPACTFPARRSRAGSRRVLGYRALVGLALAAVASVSTGCTAASSEDEGRATEATLTTPGSVDKAFGVQGTASVVFPQPSSDTSVNPVDTAVLPDGSLLLLASVIETTSPPTSVTSYVARVTKEGELDTSFGVDGIFTTSTSLSRVFALPNGKVLLGGEALLRLTPEGQLDPTFGDQGTRAWTPEDVGLGPGSIGTPKGLEVRSDFVFEDGAGGFFVVVAPENSLTHPATWQRVLHVDVDGTVQNPYANLGLATGNLSAPSGSLYNAFAAMNGVVLFTNKYFFSSIDHGTKVQRSTAASDYQKADPSFTEKLLDIQGVTPSYFGTKLLPFGRDHLVALRSDVAGLAVLTALDGEGRVDKTLWAEGTFEDTGNPNRLSSHFVAGAPDAEELLISTVDITAKSARKTQYESTIRRVDRNGKDATFQAPTIDGWVNKLAFGKRYVYAVASEYPAPEITVIKLRR